ncbi:hypothetical protein F5I97DRAFT_1130498 [Phlebopus sp. FC_14]|nr:hypothetical protein F5I97DRAFT_1130498 [Phlebopus sp. FC_14]
MTQYYYPAGPGPYSPLRQNVGYRADVPTAVHNLIRAMKSMQETLRLWSINQATPERVSDCYMQFGVEFNTIVRAFEGYDIPTNDLHTIPAGLRSSLENCLGEDPSPYALSLYMPEIRQLLYELLQGLRSKQHAWRRASGRPPMVLPYQLD